MRNQKTKYIVSAFIPFIVLVISTPIANAQEAAEHLLYKGNNSYFGGKAAESIGLYKKALEAKKDYKKANFNLGAALYKEAVAIKNSKSQQPIMGMKPDSLANLMLDEAGSQFEVVAQGVADKDTVQKALHNLGNARVLKKDYKKAIDAYKKALKINPKDEDTRYNLAYAQKKLKEEEQKNKDKKKDNKEEQKENKDKDNKDQKKENEKKDEKKEQQAQQPQMKKEDAERMLNALKNAEKKLQLSRKPKNDNAEKIKIEKDW